MPRFSPLSAAPDLAFSSPPNPLACPNRARLACRHNTLPARLPYLSPTKISRGNFEPFNFAKPAVEKEKEKKEKEKKSLPRTTAKEDRTKLFGNSARAGSTSFFSPDFCSSVQRPRSSPARMWTLVRPVPTGPRRRWQDKRPPPRLCIFGDRLQQGVAAVQRLPPFHHNASPHDHQRGRVSIGLHRTKLSRSHLMSCWHASFLAISLIKACRLRNWLVEAEHFQTGLLLSLAHGVVTEPGCPTLTPDFPQTRLFLEGLTARLCCVKLFLFREKIRGDQLARYFAFFGPFLRLLLFLFFSASLYPPMFALYYCTKIPVIQFFFPPFFHPPEADLDLEFTSRMIAVDTERGKRRNPG